MMNSTTFSIQEITSIISEQTKTTIGINSNMETITDSTANTHLNTKNITETAQKLKQISENLTIQLNCFNI